MLSDKPSDGLFWEIHAQNGARQGTSAEEALLESLTSELEVDGNDYKKNYLLRYELVSFYNKIC